MTGKKSGSYRTRKKDPLLDYLRMHDEKVEFVVMDMSPPFKAAVDKALGYQIVITINNKR